MFNLKRLLLIAPVGLALLCAIAALPHSKPSEAAQTTVDVTLTGSEENPSVKGDARAFARFVFDDATRKLDYAVTVSGLSADLVTASHIHRGAFGVNGPIIHTLSDKGFTQISGTITLSDGDVADLKAGNLYVNVHSTENPGGFARAQIYLSPGDAITATVKQAVA